MDFCITAFVEKRHSCNSRRKVNIICILLGIVKFIISKIQAKYGN